MFEAVDVREDLGHGLVEFLRHGIADFDRRVERAREWLVFDDRDAVLPRDRLDLLRDEILPFCHDDRRRHAFFVLERDGEMRRVR